MRQFRVRLVRAMTMGAFSAGLYAGAASAQATDYAGLEQIFGEPITYSATGKAQRASEVPADMTIITADDIRRSGADNIPDILQYVTGINVRRYSFGDAQIGINGYNSPMNPRLLVLVDGRQIYIDTLGFLAWNALPVQLDEIRQIEIVRGPNSALFGFNAASGVINIITFNPLYDHVNVATVRGGNIGYGGGDAVATQSIGKNAGVRISVGGWTADNYHNPVASYAPAPRYGSFNIDSRWQAMPDVLLSASGGVTDTHTDRMIFSLAQQDFQNHLSYWRLGGDAQTRFGTVNVDLYDNWGTDNARTGPIGSRLTIDTLVFRANDVTKLDADNTVRLGVEYRDSALASQVRVGGTISYQILAADLMWNWRISPMFEWTNSARLDYLALHYAGDLQVTPGRSLQAYNSANTTAISFNSGMVAFLSDTDTARLTLARGLQLPSLFDYGFQLHIGGPLYVVGAPDVSPVSVWHAEIGYQKHFPNSHIDLNAALFFERNTKLIAPQGSAAFQPVGNDIISSVQNIGSSNEIGVNLGLNGTTDGGLRWNASYAYAAIKDDIGSRIPASAVTRFENGTPFHTVIAGLGYDIGNWQFDIKASWQSAFTDYYFQGVQPIPAVIPDYVTATARLGYKLTDYLTLAATAEQINAGRRLDAAGDPIDRRFIASATLKY